MQSSKLSPASQKNITTNTKSIRKLKRIFLKFLQDVGQAILESYSRVLEGLAYNIVSWIEDVLYADTTEKSE